MHLPSEILSFYTEVLIGFSHVYHPDGLNNTRFSVKAVVLKMTPSVGMEDGTYIPRTEKEIRSL